MRNVGLSAIDFIYNIVDSVQEKEERKNISNAAHIIYSLYENVYK